LKLSPVIWVVIGLLAAVSTLYVVNTLLYLTPPNPVKARLFRTIVRLAHPLFAQNWHLFAPDPVRVNHVLTVRCRTEEGVTAWRDVTQPMLERHHRNRTSPMSRLLRVHQNAIRYYLGWMPDESRALLCKRDPRASVCRRDHADFAQQRDVGLYLLRRVAAATCDQMVGVGRTQAVQIGLLIQHPPLWSGRDRPPSDGRTESIRLPWTAPLAR